MSETIFNHGDVAELGVTGTYYTFVDGPNARGDYVWREPFTDEYRVFGPDTPWRKTVSPPKHDNVYAVIYNGGFTWDFYETYEEAAGDYAGVSGFHIAKYQFVEYV